MTQEEKARAYDEALKDMRAIYPNLKGDTKLAMEHAFPELRKSEDERIRKTLIHIVKGACSKYGIKYIGDEGEEEELLAYLEKQKEQKPVEWSLTDATFIEEIDETLFMAETDRNEVVKNQIERERNWLNSLPKRFNLQPKQE